MAFISACEEGEFGRFANAVPSFFFVPRPPHFQSTSSKDTEVFLTCVEAAMPAFRTGDTVSSQHVLGLSRSLLLRQLGPIHPPKAKESTHHAPAAL